MNGRHAVNFKKGGRFANLSELGTSVRLGGLTGLGT